jgi:hypothetical protein
MQLKPSPKRKAVFSRTVREIEPPICAWEQTEPNLFRDEFVDYAQERLPYIKK